MKIPVGISARHVHLTKEDYNLLFDEEMNVKTNLNQPGQFASDKVVTIRTEDKKIENVRVVGPFRQNTQVEISRSDARILKLNPPVRKSGDLEGAEKIIIETEKGQIERNACIIAIRHIHISNEERRKLNLTKDVYKVKIDTEKGGIFHNVIISEAEDAYLEMHIDVDDANAFNLKNNDEVEVIE